MKMNAAGGEMLQLDGISKTFFAGTVNERRALRGISLALHEGDFITIIGSNGAGKSTLLNAISGRYAVDEGTIRVDGRDVTRASEPQRARYMARVFQDPMAGTSPNLTIEQNLAIAMKRGKTRGLGLGVTKHLREHFREELSTLGLGLENRLAAKVGLLSGGQRQALSLLMAGFTNPKILLLDEHTAALDPQRADLVTELTRQIVARGNLTTLMVTHNMQQALSLGNKIVMMHEGEIVFAAEHDEKHQLSVDDLLAEFTKNKGAVFSDKSLLG